MDNNNVGAQHAVPLRTNGQQNEKTTLKIKYHVNNATPVRSKQDAFSEERTGVEKHHRILGKIPTGIA
jgi:hypothetical protein